GRRGARNGALGPLALRLDAEMSAHFPEGDLELPAQREPADDLQRIGSEVSAQHGLGGELPQRVTDEDPANGNGRQTGVVPHRGAGEELNRPVALAIPAGKRVIRPWSRPVAYVGAEVPEPSA